MSDEGRLIAGRYRLHHQIGSGAMGIVWRAVDERLNRTVAVKQLLLQPGYTREETEEARQRSMREGRIAARLQHQNAIVIFDVAEDEGQPVLVMEYLPSRSLASVLGEQGVLPPLTVARIGSQVAGALAAAHMAGIVHRDLKPGNVLLGDNDVAKITDFGISRAIGDVSVTKSGILAGTPAYLSPEVALGRDPAPASDVFSLGSTLYAAIEGEPPFGVDENAISLLHRVARGEFAPPRQAGPMTGPLTQLLSADPVDRPTMAQAREMLQAVVDGRQAPPTPSSTRRQAPAPAPAPRAAAPHRPNPPTQVGTAVPAAESDRRKWQSLLLWAMALLVAVLVGILAASAYSQGGDRADRSAPSPAPAQDPAPLPTVPAVSTPTTTTASPPSTSTSESSDEDPAEVVDEYYSLVPDKLDKAWKMLGPELKEQGKKSYERFWNTIEDVEVISGPIADGSLVTVGLLYTKKNGEISSEESTLQMVSGRNGKLLINEEVG